MLQEDHLGFYQDEPAVPASKKRNMIHKKYRIHPLPASGLQHSMSARDLNAAYDDILINFTNQSKG